MAMRGRKIEIYRDSRDYAVWAVETPVGSLIAYPGDQIHNVNGDLVLSQHPSNKSEVRTPITERVGYPAQHMGAIGMEKLK